MHVPYVLCRPRSTHFLDMACVANPAMFPFDLPCLLHTNPCTWPNDKSGDGTKVTEATLMPLDHPSEPARIILPESDCHWAGYKSDWIAVVCHDNPVQWYLVNSHVPGFRSHQFKLHCLRNHHIMGHSRLHMISQSPNCGRFILPRLLSSSTAGGSTSSLPCSVVSLPYLRQILVLLESPIGGLSLQTQVSPRESMLTLHGAMSASSRSQPILAMYLCGNHVHTVSSIYTTTNAQFLVLVM